MAKNRGKLPFRVRYEQSHPTVSCRLPREVYDRLKAVADTGGKSFSDILKVGLGILEVPVKKESEIREKAFTEGYSKGYVEAEILYKVTYHCRVCGKEIEVDTSEEMEAIARHMEEQGWGHSDCLAREQ